MCEIQNGKNPFELGKELLTTIEKYNGWCQEVKKEEEFRQRVAKVKVEEEEILSKLETLRACLFVSLQETERILRVVDKKTAWSRVAQLREAVEDMAETRGV